MSDPIRSGSVAGDVEQAVAEVVVEITDRLQAGQDVDVGAFIARCPEAAERIRRLVPALQVMESLKSAPAEGDGEEEGLTGKLGDFLIIREVGRGGMGVVYEAEQISLGRRVALKVLPFSAMADAQQLRRFHNEARAAASLEHPGVVPVYGVGCERGVHYYAMRFIDGRTLAEMVDSLRGEGQPNPTTPYSPGEPAPPSESTAVANTTNTGPRDAAYFRRVAEWVAQAAEALEHAHQFGVIHRDVKPHNLMLDGQGKLWVTDFGLARLAADNGLTMSGDLLGTLRYMAPEQALARTGLVDHRADVYGLGATLYELLTLRPAVTGNDRKEVLYRIAFEEPTAPCKLNRAVPRDLETIALKALEKSPGDRYSSAAGLAEDLRRWLEFQPLRARRPGAAQRLAKLARRHRAVVVTAAAGLVLTAAVLAGSLGWAAGERRARQAHTAQGVGAALDEARGWIGKDRPYEALSAALRAAGFWKQGGEQPELQRPVEAMLRDIRLLLRLELARLSSTAVRGDKFDNFTGDREYEKAFKEDGLDVLALDTQEVVGHIRERAIVSELADHLDYWTWMRKRARGRLDPGWRQLLAVARGVRPDVGREQFRQLLLKEDRKALEQMLREGRLDSTPEMAMCNLAELVKEDAEMAGVITLLKRGQQRRPDDFWMNHSMAVALRHERPPRLEEAVGYYRVAVALRPRSPGAYLNLGATLWEQRKVDEAIACFNEAVRLQPDYADAHSNLGAALREAGKVEEAIACFKEAIRLSPDHASAHNNLGVMLADKGEPDEAILYFKKAVALRPGDANTHNNLGIALREKGKAGEAVPSFKEAIRLKPDHADAHAGLGAALAISGRLDEALVSLQEAVRLKPDFVAAHCNLGHVLLKKGRVDEAIASCRMAIRLKPDFAEAHFNLGFGLATKGRLDEAFASYKEAVRLKPDYGEAHCNLGHVLLRQGKVGEAVASFKEATRLDPDDATVHGNLGLALRQQGRFEEALAANRRCHELGSKHPGWKEPSAQWVREAERLVELDSKLPSVLKGDARPVDAAEAAELAALCLQYKRKPVAAARLFAEAFAADPKLAQGLDSHRYNAACAAALASGGGKETAPLSRLERLAMRRQALTWLLADFRTWRKMFDNDPLNIGQPVVNAMQHWLADPDFANVRGPDALAKLPFGERQAWQQLWADVADLLARAEKTPPAQPQQ